MSEPFRPLFQHAEIMKKYTWRKFSLFFENLQLV